MLAGFPYHAPHREARIRQAGKTLYTLMLKAQLVKELLVVSSISQQSKRQQGVDCQDMTRPLRTAMAWAEFQIPVFMGYLKGGKFRITLREANALRGMYDVPGTRRMQTANSEWSDGRRP